MNIITTATIDAEIYRDSFGVPHIYGETLQAAYFGLGYCAAQDRPQTLPLHQLLVQGRLSEHFGQRSLPLDEFPLLEHLQETPFFRGYAERAVSLDTTLGVDRWARCFGYWRAAVAEYEELSARSRLIVEAFCAGINQYYELHGWSVLSDPYEPATELAW